MAQEHDTSPAPPTPPAKGYYRLPAPVRVALANVCAAAAAVATVVAFFPPAKIDGAWLRFPALAALFVVNAAAWFVFRRMGEKAPPILRGTLTVALVGVSLLAAAMHNASGFASLAGGLGLVSAYTLRGSVARAQLRGRHFAGATRTPVSYLFEQVESLASALVIVLLVWHFGLEAFRIPSGSMSPTLSGDPVWGDRVFVDKFCYQFRDPQRWEPVVFRYPLKRSDPYVKRCIGLPGEQVLIAQGDIYLRRNDGTGIELLTKSPAAREVLWLPLLRGLDSQKEWVGNFLRQGDIEFKDGEVLLGKGGSAIFPRGSGDTPGNVVDHDASFGDSGTPPESFGRNVCGDLRARLRVKLGPDGAFVVRIVRDSDQYALLLQPGSGACTLTHTLEDGTQRKLAAGQTRGWSLPAGEFMDVEFAIADGVLSARVDDNNLEQTVGTPLLDALRNRDKQRRLDLSGMDAARLAGADPAGGRTARIELTADGGGATVRVRGIERDIYYRGRVLPERNAPAEMPFGVNLAGDQYFVLGDNSPGSKDARAWIRAILRLKDGTQVSGDLDDGGQELAVMLAGAGENGEWTAMQKLQRVAVFRQAERTDGKSDAQLVSEATQALKTFARKEGRGAIDFYTEGGGYVRVAVADIETIQVQQVPYVERDLFVGRPFAVFLSPRGPKLIN